MNKYIYSVGIICVALIFTGCGDNESKEINDSDKVLENNQNSMVESDDDQIDEIYIEQNDNKNMEDELMEKLGNGESDNEEREVIDIKECDDGFVYNTELNECFEIGGEIDVEDVESKIDPVVKECNDKGGIYNAQVGKCFMN